MMIEIASKIVGCLAIAALIGFFIGYLLGRAFNKNKCNSYHINPIFTKQGNIYNKPFILGNPRPCGKDDLKQIDGITLQIENRLNTMGIFHFDQISKWTNNNCEWVEGYLGIENVILEGHWVEQAKKLSSDKRV